ncbi:hypothetical protein SAV14893_001460 [Streptomyces avermitilis]|uniref:DUF1990 domain-containing protein n=1 Tax=Streptomyces avermitilis TaxID=33903 RepID=A0A4D4LRQ6_STRAX|nr:hypothetical protein SAV14893_001460 [Streptomyces avermitilis]
MPYCPAPCFMRMPKQADMHSLPVKDLWRPGAIASYVSRRAADRANSSQYQKRMPTCPTSRAATRLLRLSASDRPLRQEPHAPAQPLGSPRAPGPPPAEALSYGPAGATCPGDESWHADGEGYRRYDRTVVIGHGDAHWRAAADAVLHWGIKRRSGFRVTPRSGAGERVTEGAEYRITAAIGPLAVHEPVRVVAVVVTPERCGFAYGTLPGHPVSGEEAFVVHRTRRARRADSPVPDPPRAERPMARTVPVAPRGAALLPPPLPALPSRRRTPLTAHTRSGRNPRPDRAGEGAISVSVLIGTDRHRTAHVTEIRVRTLLFGSHSWKKQPIFVRYLAGPSSPHFV